MPVGKGCGEEPLGRWFRNSACFIAHGQLHTQRQSINCDELAQYLGLDSIHAVRVCAEEEAHKKDTCRLWTRQQQGSYGLLKLPQVCALTSENMQEHDVPHFLLRSTVCQVGQSARSLPAFSPTKKWVFLTSPSTTLPSQLFSLDMVLLAFVSVIFCTCIQATRKGKRKRNKKKRRTHLGQILIFTGFQKIVMCQ